MSHPIDLKKKRGEKKQQQKAETQTQRVRISLHIILGKWMIEPFTSTADTDLFMLKKRAQQKKSLKNRVFSIL